VIEFDPWVHERLHIPCLSTGYVLFASCVELPLHTTSPLPCGRGGASSRSSALRQSLGSMRDVSDKMAIIPPFDLVSSRNPLLAGMSRDSYRNVGEEINSLGP